MSKYERESVRRAGKVPKWALTRPRRQRRWLPGGKEPPQALNHGLRTGVEGPSTRNARHRCAIPFKNLILCLERWGEVEGCFLGGGGCELGRQEGGPWGERQKMLLFPPLI